MSTSMQRMGRVTASTKRSPALDGSGKRGEPTTQIVELHCTPLDPADGERARDLIFRLRQELDSPFEILQTFVDAALDIVEGDILVVEGVEYPIRGASPWAWRNSRYLHLLLEASRP